MPRCDGTHATLAAVRRMTEERLQKFQELLEGVVRSQLTETDWISIQVRPAIGYDDDEVLWVEGLYRGSSAELFSPKGLKIQFELAETLDKFGDYLVVIPVFNRDVPFQRH